MQKKKHLILTSVHPSPLSCHRGFFGCKHFSKANEYLASKGREPIQWEKLPVTTDTTAKPAMALPFSSPPPARVLADISVNTAAIADAGPCEAVAMEG